MAMTPQKKISQMIRRAKKTNAEALKWFEQALRLQKKEIDRLERKRK